MDLSQLLSQQHTLGVPEGYRQAAGTIRRFLNER
jgi:hypothetical protein